MKKEERLRVYKMYDGHCAYCGKSIKYEDMQVDHIVKAMRFGKAIFFKVLMAQVTVSWFFKIISVLSL